MTALPCSTECGKRVRALPDVGVRVIPELFSSYGPDTAAVAIPAWLDLSAVVAGSFTGILVAKERSLDLVGYLALSILCGLGGGLVRDTIMQVGDVYMLRSSYAIPVTVIAAILGFLFSGVLHKFPNLLNWADIISVGLFVAAGTDKAIVYHLSPWACALMGTVTGVGGGMLRDIFLGDIPKIFKRSNLYALCAVAGSAIYYVLVLILYINRPWAALACVAIVVALRMWSLKFNVLSPSDVDLTPKATHAARVVYHRAMARGEHEGKTYVTRYTTRSDGDDDPHENRPSRT